jgi:hypothetical protein
VWLWPEPTILNSSDWRRAKLTDVQTLFVRIQALYYERGLAARTQRDIYSYLEEGRGRREACSAAIRAITSLFGQTGFDQLLAFEVVQQILQPVTESAKSVCGSLLSRDQLAIIRPKTSVI